MKTEQVRKPSIIDSHAHVYALSDPDDAIAEAKASGVVAIVVPGEDRMSNKQALGLAFKYPDFIYPAVGYHPYSMRLEDVDETLKEIDSQLPQCVALGEIGLDYKASFSKQQQKTVFSRLLGISKAHDKPVIVHTRYVHETTLSMVHEAGIRRAVFHAFNGSVDVLARLVQLGYYISATPSAEYNVSHVAALRAAPLDHILVETDTPILWSNAGGRPVHIWRSLEAVAALKGRDLEDVANQVFLNTVDLFDLPLRNNSPKECVA